MTTYYNHGGIQITSHELVVHRRRYPLDDLTQLRKARGDAPRATTAVTVAASGLGAVATLSVLLGSYGGASIGSVLISLALVAVFFLAIAATLAVRRLRPKPYELWAEYRGHTVLLLWSQNERVYNQILRAVTRARESRVDNH
ncbi:DUF6232 family protein [Actinocatenispora rupis]|uniref:Uncharacterized protein n=1 Tax=Actinocatenispora rupis TaxID=519421 RepID=A0A8J3N8J1_9ACTN|nr:DUF6232 family protein [Actinocatenispora rupis]GID10369.1 hypothetical protein Aru02nite_12580 [Actinocatenispora rupis]